MIMKMIMRTRHKVGHCIPKCIVSIIRQVFNIIQSKLCILVYVTSNFSNSLFFVLILKEL